MTNALEITPAKKASLAEARWAHHDVACFEQQLDACERTWEVRIAGELVAIGGFRTDPDLDAREVWMLPGEALKRYPRAGMDALAALLDVEIEMQGMPIFARISETAEKSQRFCRLVGFNPRAFHVADGFEYWAFIDRRKHNVRAA